MTQHISLKDNWIPMELAVHAFTAAAGVDLPQDRRFVQMVLSLEQMGRATKTKNITLILPRDKAIQFAEEILAQANMEPPEET